MSMSHTHPIPRPLEQDLPCLLPKFEYNALTYSPLFSYDSPCMLISLVIMRETNSSKSGESSTNFTKSVFDILYSPSLFSIFAVKGITCGLSLLDAIFSPRALTERGMCQIWPADQIMRAEWAKMRLPQGSINHQVELASLLQLNTTSRHRALRRRLRDGYTFRS